MSSSLLSVQDVKVCYGGIEALRGVSLDVEPGQAICLLGPNGAGKSSLLRAISGLVRPSSGHVAFLGEDITRQGAARIARSGLLHVPEGSQVFATLTVGENLTAGTFAGSTRPAVELGDIHELFPVLRERQGQVAGSLSGGEQQMLAIARALIARPVLLMLDEPSLGLAPVVIEALYARLARLKDSGTTMVIAEQQVEAVLDIADVAHLLRGGRVVESGTGEELRSRTDLLQAYV
jgi:branched-chain amino acid transport system ATP-binding protein